MRRRLRHHGPALGAMLTALLLVIGLNRATFDFPQDGTVAVTEATLLDAEAGPTTVSLPEPVASALAPKSRRLELRFDVNWTEATGLVLEGLSARTTLFLDGASITAETTPEQRPFRATQVAVLPASSGPHVLTVELEHVGYHAALGPVRVGPVSEVRRYVENQRRVNIVYPRVMLIAVATAALIVLVFAAARRRDSEFLWFGLTLLFWAMHLAWFQVRDLPVPYALWRPLSYVTLLGYVFCAALFMRRLRGLAPTRGESLLAIIAAVLSIGLFATTTVGIGFRALGDGVVIPVVLAIGTYAVVCVAGLLRDPDLPVFPLFFAATCTLLAGAHDWLWSIGLVPASQGVLEYIVPIVLAGFGALLFQRYQRAVDRITGFNDELAARIKARRSAVDRESTASRELEQARDAAGERASVLADLQRSLAPSIGELGEVGGAALPGAIRRCIEDMRLVMDGIDPAGLAAGLGNIRARMLRQAQIAGVRVNWPIADLDAAAIATVERRLCMLRTVSTGFMAALATAQADDTLTVDVAVVDDDWLDIELRLLQARSTAVALPPSIGRQVERLGGMLRAEGADGGWRLRATVPLLEPRDGEVLTP
ncbi:MAG: 7TM diverse intracellular signaling domain-containing protein [Pseudomonadota bacterium]